MRVLFPAIALLAMGLLPGCGEDDATVEYELTGSAMGTQYSVKLAEPVNEEMRSRLARDIDKAIADVEQAMSTYIVESGVSRFNASRSTDWIEVSESVCHAVVAANELSDLTNGAFDITVGPLVNLWGFGPETVELAPPPEEEIKAAQARVGYRRLHADCSKPALRKDKADLYIDLSAWAKGYAVDRVTALLDELSIRNFLVELGGELRMRGYNSSQEPWVVAIEKPTDNGLAVQMVLGLTDRAVATSGDYRNYFVHEGRRYSHLIDARAGAPVTHNLASVTIVAGEAAFADAAATALLVLGPEEGMQVAVRENIAAYFQIRLEDGYAEKMSPAFEALMRSP